ncbi:hypothetical protein Ct61P_15092 [Colletotrichum tofieldiae]|nr:hypothetical protein Ct61P_15092 [Colletotrichum tofieldiae]
MICLLEASPLAAKQSRFDTLSPVSLHLPLIDRDIAVADLTYCNRRNVPFRYRAFKEPVLGIPFEAFSSSVPGPFCLYLDASAIRTARKEHLRSLYLQYPSQEKKHLYESHLAELTADIAPSRDPYVVVMLVALAQAQRRSVQSRDRSPPLTQHTFRVHALISDVNNSSYLRVYTADVPDAFLDKLAYPRLPLTCDTSFRIEHATVPYEPYSTFQQRLMQAIPARGQKRARSCDTDEDDPYAETRWPMANPQGCVGRDGRKRLRAGSRAP